ncbi:MAG: alpha/beta fold hydrolase [Candidatus Micrarchaeota archaeon]|nr:alpha/beta fold hydrolase [Candidatus Micrarchaeota archaeon]
MDLAGKFPGHLIQFLTRDKIKLHGFLIGSRTTDACMIYVHGMGSSFLTSIPFAIYRYANAAGFALFTIDTRGHDNSASLSRYVNGKRENLRGGTDYEVFEDSWLDIDAAVGALAGLGYKRFVICGHSTGCQKAIYYKDRTKDRRVIGIAMIGPADDYNMLKSELGGKFDAIARRCRNMVRSGRGEMQVPGSGSEFSAQRLDSIINLSRVEARILNYKGRLEEFGRIKVPVYAAFGLKEQYVPMDVRTCLRILEEKSNSARFSSSVIEGADHFFSVGKEELGRDIGRWLRTL